MFIYLITNAVDGKSYVGQHSGSNLDSYWRGTLWRAANNYGKRCLLRAIRKHGAENFSIRSLMIVKTKEELDFYETGLIKILNTKAPHGYNLTDGGEGTRGYHHPPEILAKISAQHKGHRWTSEQKAKLSEIRKGNKSRIGQKRSAEEIEKQSESLRRYWKTAVRKPFTHSEEFKKKLSKRMRGNKFRVGCTLSVAHKQAISRANVARRTAQ